MKAVFTHKAASIYDDKPEDRYHFPETYLRAAQAAIGDFILCYEPGRVAAHDRGRYGRRAYVAVAQVTGIRPDPARPGFFYADIDPLTYVPFVRPVPSVSTTTTMSGSFGVPATPARTPSAAPCGRLLATTSSRRFWPRASQRSCPETGAQCSPTLSCPPA